MVTGLGCVVGLATLGHLALSPSLELSSAQGNKGTLESLSFTLCIYTNQNLKARCFSDDPSTVSQGLTKDLGISHNNIEH